MISSSFAQKIDWARDYYHGMTSVMSPVRELALNTNDRDVRRACCLITQVRARLRMNRGTK